MPNMQITPSPGRIFTKRNLPIFPAVTFFKRCLFPTVRDTTVFVAVSNRVSGTYDPPEFPVEFIRGTNPVGLRSKRLSIV